jgi:hypothetical protein
LPRWYCLEANYSIPHLLRLLLVIKQNIIDAIVNFYSKIAGKFVACEDLAAVVKKTCLLGYQAVQSVENQPLLLRT